LPPAFFRPIKLAKFPLSDDLDFAEISGLISALGWSSTNLLPLVTSLEGRRLVATASLDDA
jgi:hypothetical protein